ncbi:MAG: DUF1559 domain-containing protein [Gemmataceae bacterium]|nr:DUF1559 domain-containing protein [Gemmataceae bacterium]
MSRTVAGLVVAVGAAVGVGAPVPEGAGKLPPPTEKELATSQSNLKQLALAMINFLDVHGGRMPADSKDKAGKPLLSWRVAILPYLEQEALYKQFKLDEPWDSEHNKGLAEKMPKVFAPVRVKAKPGHTFYQVFTGPGAPFGPKPARFPQGFQDGTSNTGMIFEAGEPVVWTKPADLPYDPKKPLPKLGGLFDGEFHVARADGSAFRCRKDPDEATLRALITPSGGEVYNDELLLPKN